ncbi:hypothetical protein PFISCL1PPCAC_15887, partial [Pristionchus fissidentatus]
GSSRSDAGSHLTRMSFLFNVPDSLKKNATGGNGSRDASPKRIYQRPTTNYADLADPNGSSAPSAPERRPRLAAVQMDRSKFSLRRAPDGSIIPKPSLPPRTVTQFGAKPSAPPPSRGTFTRAGLIPAGARNPYTLKRTGPGRPSIPERHPSPATFSGGEEGEVGEEDENETRPSTSVPPPKPAGTTFGVTFGGGTRSSLFGGGTVADGGRSMDDAKSSFPAGRTASPSRVTRRREASPLQVPAAPLRAAHATGAPPETRDRSSARTLTAQDLSGVKNANEIAKQLRRLIGRACPADFDRYQLLDERDKLLFKLREIKPNFFSKSGTCKDMCPEKERYVRVVQMRVADFEVDMLGDMEPRRMVKEYSRSAADQEEPLEHELRPAPVLEMAMEYLLTDIVDSTVESSPDSAKWYDFLWNRTRAIRKELTQQMILNEAAVRLIECCTRMHMFAGFALSKLPREEFDPSMNEENLSKCLQSLRHLYEDLAKKEIFVESEAEFRAYDVMLHLNDSNILRQVLSYRRSVRESAPVRLALKLFSTIQSNNYSRFFRLVREQATFSQCCILYRYFGKMRLSAFSTMVTAYNKGGTLPMALITQQLAFENIEQAIEVASQYQLNYTESTGAPALIPDNRDFNPNVGEVAVPAAWINDKRHAQKLSEIFRGGPARISVNVDSISPVNSFDAAIGTYSYDPVLTAYLERLGTTVDDPVVHPPIAHAPEKRAPIVVERPAAAAAAASQSAAASKPAFGGLLGSSLFGKSTTTNSAGGSTTTAAAAPTTGAFFGKGATVAGSSFGSGVSSFGGGYSSFGSFKTAPEFSFGSAAGSSEPAPLPLLPKKEIKPEVSAAEVRQTAERLYDGIVEEETRKVVSETVDEEKAKVRRKEEEEREKENKEKERLKKELQERQNREAAAAKERAAVAAAAKSAEKRRKSQLSRLSSCTDHLFKRVVWPSLIKEVIDATTKEITREAVREEEQRMADGIARYKERMHCLWLRQFTDRWKAYAKWKKEERQRVRQVLAAIVSRDPFEGIGAQSMKRRLSSPDPDDWEAKRKRRGPYGNIDPLTALAVISFVERRKERIVRGAATHWREWAERRARRKHMMMWPLRREYVAGPRVRPPTPTEENGCGINGGYGTANTSLPINMGRSVQQQKRHKSRRSIGLYPFLDAEDSFLDGRATPLTGVTPIQNVEERQTRRPRVSGIFNSTAVAETTALPAIGFQTFVGRQERAVITDEDVDYAKSLMDQTRWELGGKGTRERTKRRLAAGPEAIRREDWMTSTPPVTETTPSWRGLFDALNAEPERSHERAARRAAETPQSLDATTRTTAAPFVPTPLPPLPYEREQQEKRDADAKSISETEARLAETKRLREEVAADQARQAALLARLGC